MLSVSSLLCVCPTVLTLWWLDGPNGQSAASRKIYSVRIKTEAVPYVQGDVSDVQTSTR